MSVGELDTLLRELVVALEECGIPHMVVGSFASTFHGEPRSTRDLDVVIDPTPGQLTAFLQRLSGDRFYVDADVAKDALRRRSMFNVIDMTSGWKLDLIIRKARRFSVEELERRQKGDIAGVMIDTATAEDTIISKLEWSKASASERQIDDVAGILRLRGSTLDVGYIERWVDELELREQWDRARGR